MDSDLLPVPPNRKGVEINIVFHIEGAKTLYAVKRFMT